MDNKTRGKRVRSIANLRTLANKRKSVVGSESGGRLSGSVKSRGTPKSTRSTNSIRFETKNPGAFATGANRHTREK